MYSIQSLRFSLSLLNFICVAHDASRLRRTTDVKVYASSLFITNDQVNGSGGNSPTPTIAKSVK
jgi:hypothetical protein